MAEPSSISAETTPALPQAWLEGLLPVVPGVGALGVVGESISIDITTRSTTDLLATLLSGGMTLSTIPDPAIFRARTSSGASLVEAARALTHTGRDLWLKDGLEYLECAFGFVIGEGAHPLSAPVLSLPVVMEVSKDIAAQIVRIRPRPGASLRINPQLVSYLSSEYKRTIPQLSKPPMSGPTVDIEKILDALDKELAGTELQVSPEIKICLIEPSRTRQRADLLTHAQRWLKHPFVASLASHIPLKDFSDTKPDTPDPDLPLLSDTSQSRIVHETLKGRSIIVDGLMGTGKQQVAANVVATHIGAGKTVLVLVSGPQDAQRFKARLNQASIGMLALDLTQRNFSTTVMKKSLLAAWDQPIDTSKTTLKQHRERFEMLRQELDMYPQRIHEKGPLGLSVWSGYQDELKLAQELSPQLASYSKKISVPPGLGSDLQAQERVKTLITELSNNLSALELPLLRHPWSLIGPSMTDQLKLENTVHELGLAVNACHPAVVDLLAACPELSTWATIATWLELLEKGYGRQPTPLPIEEAEEILEGIDALMSRAQDLFTRSAPVMAIAKDAYLAGKDLDLLPQLRRLSDLNWFARNLRMKSIRNELLPYLSSPVAAAQIPELLEAMGKIRQEAEVLAFDINHTPVLGLPRWEAFAPDAPTQLHNHADTVTTAIVLARDLDTHLSDLTSMVTLGREGGGLGAQVRSLASAWADLLEAASSRLQDLENWSHGSTPLGKYLQVRSLWESGIGAAGTAELSRIVAIRDMEAVAENLGIGELAALATRGSLSSEELLALTDSTIAVAKVKERYLALGLDQFSRETHDSTVEKFRLADEELRLLVSRNLAWQASQGGMQRISKEESAQLAKQLRSPGGTPTSLFKTDGKAVLARTPCVLASPETVARYLPAATDLFDVTIVLDAHCLPTRDCVPAIGRGKSTLLFGDSAQDMQLDSATLTSVLSSARACSVPCHTLTRNYSSHSKQLVDALTQCIDNPQLDSYPNPPETRKKAITVGILERSATAEFSYPELEQVPWHERDLLPADLSTIPPGALEEIVELIPKIQQRFPSSSLGVLTWHASSARQISQALHSTGFLLSPEAHAPRGRFDESFVISDLAHATGLMRDIILVVLAPLPHPQDTFTGGQKPVIDALITTAHSHARQRIHVMSLPLDSLDSDSAVRTWVNRLRSSQTPAAGSTEETPDTSGNIYRGLLAEHLQRAGLQTLCGVGTGPTAVDIAVRADEDARWVAVTLDDPNWAQIQGTRNRELGTTDILTNTMGWAGTDHIWLAQWINEPAEAIRHVVSTTLDIAYPSGWAPGSVLAVDRTLPNLSQRMGAGITYAVADLATTDDASTEPPAEPSEAPFAPPPPRETIKVTGHAVISTPQKRQAQILNDPQGALPVFTPPIFDVQSAEGLTVGSASSSRYRGEDAQADYAPVDGSLGDLLGVEAANWIQDLETVLGKDRVEPTASVTHSSPSDFEPIIGAGLPQVPELLARMDELSEASSSHTTPPAPEAKPIIRAHELSIPLPTVQTPPVQTPPVEESRTPLQRPENAEQAHNVPAPQATEDTEEAPPTEDVQPMPPQQESPPPAQVAPEEAPLPAPPPPSENLVERARSGAVSAGITPLPPKAVPTQVVGTKDMLDHLEEPEIASLMRSTLEAVLQSEGPTSTERLCKITAELFGIQRLHAKRSAALLEVLPSRHTVVRNSEGEFIWPGDVAAENFHVFRTHSTYAPRPATAITSEELANCVMWALDAVGDIDEDQLVDLVPELLDMSTVRTALRARIKTVLNNAISAGEIARVNDVYRLQ
ncbi:MAG: hypothetical protein Q4G30_03465 [Actinomycetaceae bacterium]|nr:hypothetical protein [Actinomycetaceae bacterium]